MGLMIATGGGASADDITIKLNGQGKLSLSSDFINKIAENVLNILALKVKTAVTLLESDDIAESFEDSNGLLNQVNTSNTTSFFNSDNYSNSGTGDLIDDSTFITATDGNGWQVGLKAKTSIIVSGIKFTAGGNGTWALYVKKNGVDIETITSATYSANSFYTKTFSPVLLGIGDELTISTSSATSIFKKDSTYAVNSYYEIPTSTYVAVGKYSTNNNGWVINEVAPTNSFIELDISLISKPTKAYFVALNKSGDSVGSYLFELKNDSTSDTTGQITSETLNNLSLTDTPDKLFIHQQNTSIGKITDVILLLLYD